MKNLYAKSFIEIFNEAVLFSEQNEYKKAIDVLEIIKEVMPKEIASYRYKYYYQLGTLYCLDNRNEKCIEYLNEAYKLNSQDIKVKKNLELAFSKERKKDDDNQKTNQKKAPQPEKKFNDKFKKQLDALSYSERKIHENQFKKRMEEDSKKIQKDW